MCCGISLQFRKDINMVKSEVSKQFSLIKISSATYASTLPKWEYKQKIGKRGIVCANCGTTDASGGWKRKKWTMKTIGKLTFRLCRKCYCLCIPSRGGIVNVLNGKIHITKTRRKYKKHKLK